MQIALFDICIPVAESTSYNNKQYATRPSIIKKQLPN